MISVVQPTTLQIGVWSMPRVTALNSTQASTYPAQRPLLGVASLLLSLLLLTMLDGMGKWVMAVGVPLLVFCWFRYAIHLVFVCSFIILPSTAEFDCF